MRHPIRWILGGLVLVPVLLVSIANGIADSPDDLPPPDPSLLITMPDGRQTQLFEVLANSDLVEEVTGLDKNGERVETKPEPAALPTEGLPHAAIEELRSIGWEMHPPADGDIYGLAEFALRQGDYEQALALFRSLPKEHPRYGRAQRRIGWDVYTKGLDDPDRGLAFVNRSVREDPTEGNAWQDAFRVYAATLGFLVN
ncbi:MAG: tetratricopeptide repeat protein [Planctomycetota bacterium]|jgi:hypothetical protein